MKDWDLLKDRKQVVNLSGGKDSTAMLHWMIERGDPIHSVVFFDTGWEFPAMYDHLDLVEEKTGIEIVRLKPERSFYYWMLEREIVKRKGPNKGNVHRIGYGWPSPLRRWCTSEKVKTINKYLKKIASPVSCIGIAFDETHRMKGHRYPLIEYGKTESDCLKYCERLGYHWDGLYKRFSRVSCFCCPLKGLEDLRNLRRYYPELWEQMLEWDAAIPGHNRGFHHYDNVHDLEMRFSKEDKQLVLWPRTDHKESESESCLCHRPL